MNSEKNNFKCLFASFILVYLIICLCSVLTCLPCLSVKLIKYEIEQPKSVERTLNYNLRNMGKASSNEELNFLLNVRKLILFSVHTLNKPLRNTGCLKWFANPLDLVSYEEIGKSDNKTHLRIKFILQPGNSVNLVAEILQKDPPIDIRDTELEIVSFELIGAAYGPCQNVTLSENVKKTCVCAPASNIVELQKTTEDTRQIWNVTDPELITWHPSESFMVEDYMNFTDYEWFRTSPGKTKDEISRNKYSSEFCGPKLKMLVMISSAPTHFVQRKNIRETFGSEKNLNGKGIKVVFLMGIPTNTSMHAEVVKEAELSKDIIQANFADSYHNLSISHLSMYNWVQLTCENGKDHGVTLPRFILKADDDMFLNVDLALKAAEENTDAEFMGTLYCGTGPVRSIIYMTKYYTPRYMHISGSYQGYLSGVAYVMQTHVIPRILHMSLTTPMIHMDDAYITGILLKTLRIYPKSSLVFTAGRIEPDECKTKTTVNSSLMDPDDMLKHWKKFVEPLPTNCSLNNLPIKYSNIGKSNMRSCFFE